MKPVLLSVWPRGRRPRCQACNRQLLLARQIDGTMIQFCESACRNELGLPFAAAHPRSGSVGRAVPTRVSGLKLPSGPVSAFRFTNVSSHSLPLANSGQCHAYRLLGPACYYPYNTPPSYSPARNAFPLGATATNRVPIAFHHCDSPMDLRPLSELHSQIVASTVSCSDLV